MTPFSESHLPTSHGDPVIGDGQKPPLELQPVITNEIRARIIATLATFKGKRGAPFSFVTSGDKHSLSARSDLNDADPRFSQSQQSSEQTQMNPPSLKLSWLLRPLRVGPRPEVGDGGRSPAAPVKMPSYMSSMTLGQTITDPIEGGMLSLKASMALFEYFISPVLCFQIC
jgi:hypothetical protein